MAVLLLEPIHPEALARLASIAPVRTADTESEALQAAGPSVRAIVTRGRAPVTAALLAACPALDVVARVGVGLDNIDVAAATRQGVPVINAPGSTTGATAEHTMMLLLALIRRLPDLHAAVRDGRWDFRRHYRGGELAGRTLGIVGLGAIGQRVAVLATAFGMDVCYWSRRPKAVPYRAVTLPLLFAQADVVSLHVALTPSTRGLLDAAAFAQMRPGTLLVNTARGGVVDPAALLHALDHGPLAGYATDVFTPEPPHPDDPLLRHPKVVATPHTAALTHETFRAMGLRMADNVVAVLQGAAPEQVCVVNAAALATNRSAPPVPGDAPAPSAP